MKKMLLVLMLLFSVGHAIAQQIITDKDSIGYLMPDFWRLDDCNSRGNKFATGNAHQRVGNISSVAIESTRIYGIVTILETPTNNLLPPPYTIDTHTHPEPWSFLYKPIGDSYGPVDSAKIPIEIPSRYLMVPQYNAPVTQPPWALGWLYLDQNQMEQYMDTATQQSLCIFPLYESFFRRGYPIDDTTYALLVGSTYMFSENSHSASQAPYLHFYGIATYPDDILPRIQHNLQYDTIEIIDDSATLQFPIYAITDRNLWLSYALQNCFTVDSISIDPVAGHDFYVHWTDETLHDLYELRYGPANADTSTYTVVTTTDTAVTLTGFAHDSSYVFLLRALCLYEDTIATWSRWVETHYGIHCPPIGDMTVAMDAEHSAALSWTGAEGYARYEVAYGLSEEDETAWTVVSTTDTMVTVSGLLYDTLYAFRVRGLCSYEDSTAYWSVWSDAVTGRVPGYVVGGRSNYSSWGHVEGGGVYESQSIATLTAVPTETGQFVLWDDGEEMNPRSIMVESDTLLTAQFAAKPPAGMAESDGGGMLLVPNPATREVRITAAVPIRQVTVYDATGRQVALLHPDSAELLLDVERWAAGTYTLSIATDKGTTTRKLVRN